jgi:hypothetical protein
MAVFVWFNTNRCSLKRFNTNSDKIPKPMKKIDIFFDLYHNYSFPDRHRSNSAQIYVV